jgi:hypothetical protein
VSGNHCYLAMAKAAGGLPAAIGFGVIQRRYGAMHQRRTLGNFKGPASGRAGRFGETVIPGALAAPTFRPKIGQVSYESGRREEVMNLVRSAQAGAGRAESSASRPAPYKSPQVKPQQSHRPQQPPARGDRAQPCAGSGRDG